METKIIPFPSEHFQRKKQRPLTKLMIGKLLAAYSKEIVGLFFGPKDIKGSLTSLIARGLIIRIEITDKGQIESIWHVTNEAIEMLKNLGIEVPCSAKKNIFMFYYRYSQCYKNSRNNDEVLLFLYLKSEVRKNVNSPLSAAVHEAVSNLSNKARTDQFKWEEIDKQEYYKMHDSFKIIY